MAGFSRGVFRWTRHSRILLGAGAIYIGIGVSFFYTPKIYAKAPSLKIPLEVLSLDGWGWVYIACGTVAVISGFLNTKRPLGYMVLTAISTAWALFYIAGVIFEKAPKLTLITGLLFGMLGFVWIEVSGFISPEAVKQIGESHENG